MTRAIQFLKDSLKAEIAAVELEIASARESRTSLQGLKAEQQKTLDATTAQIAVMVAKINEGSADLAELKSELVALQVRAPQ